jgi:peptidoglycan/xylan/chitin deacetylase (PgdA/CDA1 family)
LKNNLTHLSITPVHIVPILAFFFFLLCVMFPTPQACAQEKSEAGIIQSLPPRAKPPIIILKLDDLSQKEGTILPGFVKMEQILSERNIKGSFGLICAVTWKGAQSLEESGEEYINWVKKLHNSGQIEIWFHGWDHAGHTVDGELYSEFNSRTFEEQKARFDRAQKLAEEKLGFTFKTFGPGGTKSKHPSTNDDTARVVAADPHIHIYFKNPKGEVEEKMAADGKVTFLHRVPGVSIERAVGEPDFNAFLTNYAKHPNVDYFILQGHPNTWDDAKFAEVVKIIDFLIAQKAVFMKPSEYVATLRKK